MALALIMAFVVTIMERIAMYFVHPAQWSLSAIVPFISFLQSVDCIHIVYTSLKTFYFNIAWCIQYKTGEALFCLRKIDFDIDVRFLCMNVYSALPGCWQRDVCLPSA